MSIRLLSFIPSTYGAVVTGLAIISCSLLWIYYMSVFDYWKRRGIPEIPWKARPLFGHTAAVILGKITFNDFFLELYKVSKDKSFVGFFQGSRPFLLVNDPELIRNILVKDFPKFMNRGFEVDEKVDPLSGKALSNLKDQRWKEMRSRLSPTFTSGRMKAMFPLMKSCADVMEDYLLKEIKKNSGVAVLEVKELFSCFTTDVIATCAFGVKSDSLRQPNESEFRKMGKKLFSVTWWRSFLIVLFFISPKLIELLRIKFLASETEIFFRNFVEGLIKKREDILEKDGDVSKFGDFIHMLVLLKKYGVHALKDKDDSSSAEAESSPEMASEETSWSAMTPDDLTAQVLLFFSAGFETTAALLTFTLFELSYSENGQKLQNTLRQEVLASMKNNRGIITYESLKKIHLLEYVLSETLRLHPPAVLLTRRCSEPYTLPGTTVTLDKGTAIAIPLNALQKDSKYFPDPMEFEPSRFSPANKADRNSYVFLPFGDGPRMCIGQRFAQMQAQLGLASLISRFKFEICTEKTTVPLKFNPRGFSTTPEGGIWMRFTELS